MGNHHRAPADQEQGESDAGPDPTPTGTQGDAAAAPVGLGQGSHYLTALAFNHIHFTLFFLTGAVRLQLWH